MKLGNIMISLGLKFIYAFVWQEETFVTLTKIMNNRFGHVVGSVVYRVLVPLLTLVTDFPVYDLDLMVNH